MKIKITSSIGTGNTELSALDKALDKVGISDYNLIKISSIIPPNSEIQIGKLESNPNEYGHKLFVVLSANSTKEIGKEIWSGLGWVVNKDNGKGLFVEHNGCSKKEVEKLIRKTLTDMKGYRLENYGEINIEIIGAKCVNVPICTVVVAVYQSENWSYQ